MKYPEYIMKDVRQSLGVEDDDTSRDSAIDEMDPMSVWTHYLIWNGIIGYEYKLHEAHDDIFNPEQDESVPCTCGDEQLMHFGCICKWVTRNPGNKDFTCEFCGIYTAGRPQCNKCEEY